MSKKKHSLTKVLFKLLVLVPTLFSLIGKVVTLAGYEAKLAGRSLIVIIILSLLAGVLFATTWLGILAMLFMYLVSLQLSWQISLFILIIVNLCCLAIILCVMNKIKKNLLFPETREQLREVSKIR